MYAYFTADELACRCGCGLGEQDMSPSFMRRLIDIRRRLDFPFIVTSAARCADYNDRLYVERGYREGAHRRGPHTPHTVGQEGEKCHAVDIRVRGDKAYRVLVMARDGGFTGIGVFQRGPHEERFVHLDDLPAWAAGPRPWVWSY